MPSAGIRTDERGFTLIELLVTMVILAVGLGGTLSMVDGANKTTVITKEREGATSLIREVLEDARSVPDSQQTATGLSSSLQAFPGLVDSTPGGAWTVVRRNQTYTLTGTVCAVDDPKDGYGNHSGADFCPGSAGSEDTSPEDYKRVAVTAEWTRDGVKRTTTQSGILGHETSNSGIDLDFIDYPGSEITTNTSPLRFTVQTTEPAAKIVYAVAGVVKFTATPSSTTSDFNWAVDGGADGHVYDGTYVISATAYDSKGRPGPTRSVTVKLNRDLPLAVTPSSALGGWNARLGVVEIEWNRNPEPDVMGYRVWRERSNSANKKLVCEFLNQPTATSCIDTAPKNQQVDYTVVALDTAPGTLTPREGAIQTSLSVKKTTDQPTTPSSLTATASSGNVVLSWPASPTPSYTSANFPPQAIRFYRIYRDGTAISNRIAVSTSTTFTHQNAAGKGYKYYVTAVDKDYSESTPVGPVP
jgi:prepilin-type N-terminal cleavage/methylation domain-containing protein